MFGSKKKGAKKIIIVEDDALLSQVLLTSFSEEGFDAVGIMNGLEVMDAVKKNHPVAILLDLMLPGIDGFTVLKQLKGKKETKDIPVIVISNLGDVSDVKSVKALGAEGYFIKSNTKVDKIIEAVKKIIK